MYFWGKNCKNNGNIKKNSLLLGRLKQTEYTVMMSMEASTKIVNFMTQGAGVSVLRRGYIGHIVKMHSPLESRLLYSCQP